MSLLSVLADLLSRPALRAASPAPSGHGWDIIRWRGGLRSHLVKIRTFPDCSALQGTLYCLASAKIAKKWSTAGVRPQRWRPWGQVGARRCSPLFLRPSCSTHVRTRAHIYIEGVCGPQNVDVNLAKTEEKMRGRRPHRRCDGDNSRETSCLALNFGLPEGSEIARHPRKISWGPPAVIGVKPRKMLRPERRSCHLSARACTG